MKIPKTFDELKKLKGFKKIEAKQAYNDYLKKLKIKRKKDMKKMQYKSWKNKKKIMEGKE